MPGKLKISFILFFVIILLPTLIFSLVEINSFSQYEEMIDSSYKDQLETMLTTINQKTDDIINEWKKTINNELKSSNIDKGRLLEISSQMPSVQYIFKSDGKKILYTSMQLSKEKVEYLERLLSDKQQIINRLIEYIEKSDQQRPYRKPEAFKIEDSDDIIILFICDANVESKLVCGFILNSKVFIDEILGPKIQEIAREKFNIFVFEGDEKNIIYNSDRNEKPKDVTKEKPFWLLPGYTAGISLKSTTISEITRPRTRNLLIIIILVNLTLLFGVYLLFKNMRGEMELTLLKSEFVSNVSHEIRTPLALIQMYIETLQMDRIPSEEKKKEYYNVVLQETIRLSGIVNKILSFTQMEKGKRKYQFSDTDINDIVEKIMCTYRYHFENKGFDYTMELTDDLPLIFADKEAINESVVNLIDNAIKYSGEKKMIVLRTGKIDGDVYIEVKDFGIGISEKDQKHIFDKFYRVSAGDLAYKAKGTGLGLTIVKHVMDAHKGQILVQSKKDSGSSFKLIFPPEGALA